MLEGLSALVDLNLLRREETPVRDSLGTEVRFSMLETIREYGREQLTASGEIAAVRRRHADYYLALAEQAAPHFWRAEQLVRLDRFDEELDNLRVALAYRVERGHGGDAVACELGLYVAGRLSLFWLLRAYIREGLTWLEQLLDTPPAAARTKARGWALWTAAALAGNLGDRESAHRRAEECVAIFRELGDRWSLAVGLTMQACPRLLAPACSRLI